MQRARTTTKQVYDAIVVGSGATGGWAAKALTERGMKVLVLEAGRDIDPAKDYHMLTEPFELKYRGLKPGGPGSVYAPRQPIQSRCYAANEYLIRSCRRTKRAPVKETPVHVGSRSAACLIRCAEIHDEPRIVTFDRDFAVYKWARNKRFTIISNTSP